MEQLGPSTANERAKRLSKLAAGIEKILGYGGAALDVTQTYPSILHKDDSVGLHERFSELSARAEDIDDYQDAPTYPSILHKDGAYTGHERIKAPENKISDRKYLSVVQSDKHLDSAESWLDAGSLFMCRQVTEWGVAGMLVAHGCPHFAARYAGRVTSRFLCGPMSILERAFELGLTLGGHA